ncbi:response regulator [Haliangium sp.]|uniref:response regulator n=1 Tax=Haliangium sp. TaxID=2663208 RepID=UPI003D0F9FBD
MPTVLIVDDDKYTQTVLRTAFTQDAAFAGLDVEAITADNGEAGLSAFRTHRPSIVATDLRMPRMDGISLCRAIRAESGGGEVHLIAMTGASRDSQVADSVRRELGAAVFAKPYQLRDMATYIAALVAGAEPAPTTVAGPVPTTGSLAGKSLPALLFDLLEAQTTGRLTLRRARIEKRIELIVGHPLSVWSSAREETLGAFLAAAGIITGADLTRAVRWAAREKRKVGDALIALGVVTPENMLTHLTMHTCHKLVHTLRWPDGDWRLDVRDPSPGGVRGNPIDMVPLVLQGLRHTASFDGVPERLAAVGETPLMLTPRGQRLLPSVRQYLSSKLADEWRDGNLPGDLLAAGVERGELYTTLEALLFCEAVAVYEGDSIPVATADTRDTGDFSIEELSEHSQIQRTARGQDEAARELYAMLFDDPGIMSPVHGGELPLELVDEDDADADADAIEEWGPRSGDSGVIPVADLKRTLSAATAESESSYARRLVLKEYLRIQGRSYYEILDLEPDAKREEIESEVTNRRGKFALDWFSRYDLGRDYTKLEELHAAYDRAAQVLCDPDTRAAYDRSLSGGERRDTDPVSEAEIEFHAGRDLLDMGKYEWAVQKLQAAVTASPDEADYRAALGWALYLHGGRTAEAADLARPHLNEGLAINPDHALSHEYKGRISAEQGTDDEEAMFHLQRSLEADASHIAALSALESIWRRRGEFRPLEHQYRRLIYRLVRTEPTRAYELWLKLAALYRDELHEPDNARIAFTTAARLAPTDELRQAAIDQLDHGTPERLEARRTRLRRAWRLDPMNPEPGRELMDAALAANLPDTAFLAASALVARGCADSEAETYYRRYRPRFLIRAQRQLDPALWSILRHPHDEPAIDELFALIGPAVAESFPLSPQDMQADELTCIDENELPEAFVRVRAYVAHMLGVAAPTVAVRPDFGHQIHIGAFDPPLILAGDDALLSPERAELGFRLGRAMTYLLPGRTIAASRPARLLKAAVLALFGQLHPSATLNDPHGHVARAHAHLGTIDPKALTRALELVAYLTSQSQSLNLSRWVRALGRTADRTGLLLCGDLPAAVRFARDIGSADGVDDLVDFAVSDDFATLRIHTGLSVDV